MMVLTFRDVSKFASVNPDTEALISDGSVIFIYLLCKSLKTINL